MQKNTSTIVAVIVVILIVGGLIWWGKSQTPTGPKETIKIGFVGPLSGDLAFIGESDKNAILLAKDELKDTKFNYEVIVEDVQIDPKLTANATNKLINIDKVDGIISVSSGIGNVVSPITEQNKTIHFGLASDSNIAKGIYNFIHW
ncbi:MAG: ABC transporter substrate-binding protein, partial [Patescibacteria group bacterium]